MGRADSSALPRCIGDPVAFFTDYYARAPYLRRGGGFADLLSMADVDRQLTGSGLRPPTVRAVRDGVPIDPTTWTRQVRTGSSHVNDLVHPGRLMSLFADGATIVLQSLQRWWPPLSQFCRDLEGALGHAVQANAYLTPAEAAGLKPHHDTHDVFVMQVFGQKHWTVREPLVEAPLARHHSDHAAAANQPVLFEADLHPGDCLYLPRGFIHSATAQEGASLHLTVGVLATTVHDVLRRLVDEAGDELAFRRALPATPKLEDHERSALKAIIADFVEWLDRFDLDRASDDTVRSLMSRRTHRTPLLDGQLLQLVQMAEIDDHTAVIRRSPTALLGQLHESAVRLELGDRTLELPAQLHPALDRLFDGMPHLVSELGDLLDGPSRLVLIRRLVREGALRTVDGA